MNGACETPEARLCGCCAGIGPETPEPITNRPGLSVVAYRVGTHATFKASMLAALSDPDFPALAPLRTHEDSDFTIALLDAWATALDILTFYQERIANESYLRTAADPRSVFELARLVGYRPSPGVAASAFLAFTLSNAPGSPDHVLIPSGSRVQSVPGPGQTPQVFETQSDLTALTNYNALAAQTTVSWGVSTGDTFAWLEGTSNNLNVGDGLLFMSAELQTSLASGSAEVHFITAVLVNPPAKTTYVAWDQPLSSWVGSNNNGVNIYVLRKKAALFGVQAPDPRTLSSTNNKLSSLAGWPSGGQGDWTFQYASGSSIINLDASYTGLAPIQGGVPEWTVLISPDYTALFQVTAAAETGPVLYTLTAKTTQLTLAKGQVLVNNVQSQANLAQLWLAFLDAWVLFWLYLSIGVPYDEAGTRSGVWQAQVALEQALAPVTMDQVLASIVSQTRSATAFVQSELLTPAAPPYLAWTYDGTYQRQSGLLKPVEGSSVEIIGGQRLSGGQPIAISGKRLRLRVATGSLASFMPQGGAGSLAVTDGETFIVNAFPPAVQFFLLRDRLRVGGPRGLFFPFGIEIGEAQAWQVVTTSGVSGSLSTPGANITLLPADQADAAVGEPAMISQTSVAGSITTLGLVQPLARIYDRATVSINANVVLANHGETVHEILGSGDATNAALTFALKQGSLTHVSVPRGTGASSTLQVWVNNLRWHEVDNFLASGPTAREFVTRADPKGTVTVQFGDGIQGERTPTAPMNIRATYRKGTGLAGMVQAGQLSQPLDRPQGLKSVTNPGAATGGQDPDSAADVRASAPLHVLTLDRVVSLEDYQNYALAFAGIAKALATWTWFGRTRGVYLTVAGADGAGFQVDDPTVTNLATALHDAGNRFVPLQIASYRPVLFEVGASVRVDQANYDPAQVLGQVWQTLSAAFSFAQRQMGQGVALSEIIAVIQQTPGVVAVEMTVFNRQGVAPARGTALPAVLRAAAPVAGQNAPPTAAEMLLLDPASKGGIEVWA